MKKRTVIIPVVILIVLAVAMVAKVLYTTDFVYGYEDAGCDIMMTEYNKKEFNKLNTMAYFAEKNYEFVQNQGTLDKLAQIYSPYTASTFGKFKDKLPDDYYDKCIKYNKMQEDYYVSLYSLDDFDCVVDTSEEAYAQSQITKCISNYAWTMYIKGDTEQAKSIIEQRVSETELENNMYGSLMHFSNFFSYIQMEDDVPEADKQWAEDLKTDIQNRMKEIYPESESSQLFFMSPIYVSEFGVSVAE